MATAAPGPTPLPRRALWLRVVLGLLGLLGVTIGTLGWVLASAPGASPDDDYHMASVWCPPPLESSGCVVVIVEDGTPHVEVPDAVVNASTCYRFQPNISAGCTTGMVTSIAPARFISSRTMASTLRITRKPMGM